MYKIIILIIFISNFNTIFSSCDPNIINKIVDNFCDNNTLDYTYICTSSTPNTILQLFQNNEIIYIFKYELYLQFISKYEQILNQKVNVSNLIYGINIILNSIFNATNNYRISSQFKKDNNILQFNYNNLKDVICELIEESNSTYEFVEYPPTNLNKIVYEEIKYIITDINNELNITFIYNEKETYYMFPQINYILQFTKTNDLYYCVYQNKYAYLSQIDKNSLYCLQQFSITYKNITDLLLFIDNNYNITNKDFIYEGLNLNITKINNSIIINYLYYKKVYSLYEYMNNQQCTCTRESVYLININKNPLTTYICAYKTYNIVNMKCLLVNNKLYLLDSQINLTIAFVDGKLYYYYYNYNNTIASYIYSQKFFIEFMNYISLNTYKNVVKFYKNYRKPRNILEGNIQSFWDNIVNGAVHIKNSIYNMIISFKKTDKHFKIDNINVHEIYYNIPNNLFDLNDNKISIKIQNIDYDMIYIQLPEQNSYSIKYDDIKSIIFLLIIIIISIILTIPLCCIF